MFHFYCRRPHPYRRVNKLSSARLFDSKSPDTGEVALDSNIENNLGMVNEVEYGRKQGLPVFHKASSSKADQTSKWSKFLSTDATTDDSDTCSQLDFTDRHSSPVSTNMLLAMVSAVLICSTLYTTYSNIVG